MATNIEQIFRDFVINKIRQIEDEGQNSGVTGQVCSSSDRPRSVENRCGDGVTSVMESHGEEGEESCATEMIEHVTSSHIGEEAGSSEIPGTVDVAPGKEGSEALGKKNKKHKRPKSKKKKKKKKKRKDEREKESSWESGVESGSESQAKPCVKDQGASGKESAADGATGLQQSTDNGSTCRSRESTGHPMLDEDGKMKKHKRHVTKKKKKQKKEEERKSASRSRTESTSASESASELRSSANMPSTSFPHAALSPVDLSQKLLETMEEVPRVEHEVLCARSSGKDSEVAETHRTPADEEKRMSSSQKREMVLAELGDNQEQFPKSQDLPDIIPKLQSVHRDEAVKSVSEILTSTTGHQDLEYVEKTKSRSASQTKSRSKSQSVTRVQSTAACHSPQKSQSHSHTPRQTSEKLGSSKARSSSRGRSVSMSKRRSGPRKRRSRSQSGKHKSRSTSLKKLARKSRSLSTRKRRRSNSISHSRNKRSRSRRRTCSRSNVRRRRSGSRSHSRRRRTRSRSKRSQSHRHNQRSRSVRRGRHSISRSRSHRRRSISRSRRSRSRSFRKTRRTRSRSIVILRRSRSRSLLRRNRRSRSRSLRRNRSRSVRRHQSKSQSRRSRFKSPVRHDRSKTPSTRCGRRSKSRSPTRCHPSRSKSPKSDQKQSKSPKRSKHSKLWSPSKNKSKSRSLSRDGQSAEQSTTLGDEKGTSGSPAKEQLGVEVPPFEMCDEGTAPERTEESDGQPTDKGISSEGDFMKGESPLDPGNITIEVPEDVNTDDANTVVPSVGSWRPVPFLADSAVKPEPCAVEERVTSVEVRALAMEPSDCNSPKMDKIDKFFMPPQIPLSVTHFPDSSSQATFNQDLESCSRSVSASEDTDKQAELKSCSPKPSRSSEELQKVPESTVPEISDLASSTEVKCESGVEFPCEQISLKSPVDQDSSEAETKLDRSRSRSTSKACESPAEKKDSEPESHLSNKKEQSSKQEQSSPARRKSSKSRSPLRRKKSKSRSPSRRKRSRSNSSFRKRQSNSNAQKKNSKPSSPGRKRKSHSRSQSQKKKSKSPTRRRRSRSKSTNRRKKSRSVSASRSSKRRWSKSRSPVRKKRSKSRSPRRGKQSKSRSQTRRRRSKSGDKSNRSKSRSPARKGRSRSSNRARRSRSRSHSLSRRRRGGFRSRSFDRRDRWRREPSHSPILILRKKRSTSRTRHSSSKTPPRLTDLDKDQLLEIAKANAAAMCAKAGMPVPESLRPKAILQLPLPAPIPSAMNVTLPLSLNLPMGMPMGMPNITMNAAMASMTAATMTAALTNMGALASMPPLPSITNKPPPTAMPNTANIEEVKRKVVQKANSMSIKELTEKCKMIAESKEEMAIALPHVSDDEEDEKPFGGGALRENKGISFSLSNPSAKPAVRTEAAFAKEFPVSSGSQHRKKESNGAYGEWVPVDRKVEKDKAAVAGAEPEDDCKDSDSVFPDAALQPVDITVAVSERAVAQKRLAQNPFDVSAMCMLSRAQEQVDAWAQSNSIPGLFTGSTGAQVLSSEELSNSGPQAWIKKDQFLRAAPVSGGVGEFLMRKMGWRVGEGLGKHREGTVEPIVIDFKTDRKGLVAEGEKMQKCGSLVVMKDLMGKHPVSALMEICNKKKWSPPEFVMVHHSGPDHRKNFLFKVVVNGTDYQPQTASPNKKHAKAMAATVALQAMGEVSGDSVHTGPVFTAATSTD